MTSNLTKASIKRFIVLDTQVTACNMSCSYCYVRQQNRNTSQIPVYTDIIPRLQTAFSIESLGGLALIYLYADGEPLLPPDMLEVLKKILEIGHYVAIVTNMTTERALNGIAEFPQEWRERILFFCSLHYLELVSRNKLQQFTENVEKMRKAGCSCVVRLCLAPDYLPCLDEIYQYCVENLGGGPVLCHYVEDKGVEPETEKLLVEAAKRFNCYAYDFQKEINKVAITDYCHAGEWSYAVELASGNVRSCLHGQVIHNLYEQSGSAVPKQAVGYNCPLPWCMCGAHFLSWGVRPAIQCESYAHFFDIDGKCYLSPTLQQAFSTKLAVTNSSDFSE